MNQQIQKAKNRHSPFCVEKKSTGTFVASAIASTRKMKQQIQKATNRHSPFCIEKKSTNTFVASAIASTIYY